MYSVTVSCMTVDVLYRSSLRDQNHIIVLTTTIFKHADTNSSSCTSCLVYIITGSVVGIIILVVVCTLLFSVMVYIILHSKKSDTSSRDHSTPELPDPVYEYITSPVYEYLNPIVTSVMTENEAYNSCCEEIKAYDIV